MSIIRSKTPRRLALSYPLSTSTPIPDGGLPVQISATSRLSRGDLSDTNTVQLWNHAGTHIDGPGHMVGGKGPLTDYIPLTGFYFTRTLVLDVPCDDDALITATLLETHKATMSQCELLLLRTGFSRFREVSPERYRRHNPGLDATAAQVILDKCPGVRCVGIDAISFAAAAHLNDGIAAHKSFFGASTPVLLIEDLNLNHDLSSLRSVWIAPLLIESLDSCPCTVVAELEEA